MYAIRISFRSSTGPFGIECKVSGGNNAWIPVLSGDYYKGGRGGDHIEIRLDVTTYVIRA